MSTTSGNCSPEPIGWAHSIARIHPPVESPVTVSFGHGPLLLVFGGTEVPAGIADLECAGAVLDDRAGGARTGDGVPIPAGSEIAVGGWPRPDNLRDEGPFGEWTGHYSGRDTPNLLGAPPARPPAWGYRRRPGLGARGGR